MYHGTKVIFQLFRGTIDQSQGKDKGTQTTYGKNVVTNSRPINRFRQVALTFIYFPKTQKATLSPNQ